MVEVQQQKKEQPGTRRENALRSDVDITSQSVLEDSRYFNILTHAVTMAGDASPAQLRHSESSQSINRQIWDSSGMSMRDQVASQCSNNLADPTRNPAPLPLPDHHAPVSSIRTQSKVSAAHRKLGSASSSRSLSQHAQEHEQPAPGIYDLVTMIHTNLETLMKRSQNNARDLGKLRGDVRNPQAIEEIKKILQDSSAMNSNGDTHDPEQKRQMDSEMAVKLDALLKMSALPQERPSTAPPLVSTDHLASAQNMSAMKNELNEALSSIQSTLSTHLPVVFPEQLLDSRLIGALDDIQATLDANLPVVIPEPAPLNIPESVSPPPLEPIKVSIDTSELESVVSSLCAQITEKVMILQKLDATLLVRTAEIASLESRSVSLQSTLAGMITKLAETRVEEAQRQQGLEDQRVSKNATTMRKKKSVVNNRVLVPLAPSAERRIVSLSNVPSSPSRKTTPQNVVSSPASTAAPLVRDSSFLQQSFTLPNSVNPNGGEVRLSPHRLQTTMRTPDDRRSSWSKRVSQLFLSGGNNKENPGAWVVDKDSSKNQVTNDEAGTDTIGRGHANRNSMRSFRSFSHRV